MATCFCLRKVEDLLRSLIPVARLNVKVPLVVPKLAVISQAITPMAASSSSSASMSSTVALAMSLPTIPIHASLVARLAANLAAMQQINAALGANVASTSSASQVQMTIRSMAMHLNAAMAAMHVPPQQLVAALNLTSTLATVSQFRTSFGIDLLAPTASAQLRAALQARLAAGTPAAAQSMALTANAAANLAAYAQLAAAAQAAGGLNNLIPTMRVMANLQVPMPSMLAMNQLSTIMALQQMNSQIQAVLGLNPLAANLSVTIRQALQPLSVVQSLAVNAGAAATTSSTTPVTATVAAQISALARMDLRMLASLKIPDLAPLRLVAQFATTFPITSTSSCGPGCPVAF